jgi:hypothetical protein
MKINQTRSEGAFDHRGKDGDTAAISKAIKAVAIVETTTADYRQFIKRH